MSELVVETKPKQIEKALPVEIVAPIDVDRLAEAFRTFQEFKQRLLTKDDSVLIAGRQYLKKSAWRKWALACAVSDELVSYDRLPAQGKDSEGNFSYRVVARAFHEHTGRCSVGVAVASRKEKKDWAHEEHDIFTLAHTRAKNRAIADLVGGGEVTAEEMTTTHETPKDLGPKREERPAGWKPKILPYRDPVAMKTVRQVPLLEGTLSIGMVNILADNSELSIVPQHPVPAEEAPIKGFLIPRVLDAMKEKHQKFEYQLQVDQGILQAIFVRGDLTEPQIKELVNGARWAFQKATEHGT